MPKVYSVVEVRSKTWAIMIGSLAFFVSLSLILCFLWPMELSKRREAEQARERLMIHAHRLAQAKVELQKQLQEERERKEAILSVLKQTQGEVGSLQNQLAAQADQMKTLLEASSKSSRQVIEMISKQKGGGVSLGKVVVGAEQGSSK